MTDSAGHYIQNMIQRGFSFVSQLIYEQEDELSISAIVFIVILTCTGIACMHVLQMNKSVSPLLHSQIMLRNGFNYNHNVCK